MTNPELSNEFDVLYDNITSGNAPGIDEYEKSIFLTRAQNDIIRSYFTAPLNRTQTGYDESERRQIDFSSLTKSMSYDRIHFVKGSNYIGELPTAINTFKELESYIIKGTSYDEIPSNVIDIVNTDNIKITPNKVQQGKPQTFEASPFVQSNFDMKDNTVAVALENNILLIINEYVSVTGRLYNDIAPEAQVDDVRLAVIPISYSDYSLSQSKPYKRPSKNVTWRLFDNSTGYLKSELILPLYDDKINQYMVRYVERPKPIILESLGNTGLSIQGYTEELECTLDPSIHPDIVQKAVELAKAAYEERLSTLIATGVQSGTEAGIAISQQQ